MKVTAAVFSGGGVKGADSLASFRRALLEHPGQRMDGIFGVSTGALSAGLIAQGVTWDEQLALAERGIAIYEAIDGNDAVYTGGHSLLAQGWHFLTSPALYDPKGLWGIVRRHIDPDRLRRGVHFSCGAVQHESGEYEVLDNGLSAAWLHPAIMASASMPVFFPPVTLPNGQHYCDGGISTQAPLSDAVHWLKQQPADERELWIFLTAPLTVEPPKESVDRWRGPQVLLRTLDIALNTIYRDDLLALESKNLQPSYVPIRAMVSVPTEWYPEALDFDPKAIRHMLAAGANRVLPEPTLLAFPPEGK